MSRNARLPHHETIYQYLMNQGFDLYCSKPVLNHMVHFIDAITQKGFSGTLTDIHSFSYETRHRTTLSHFLHRGRWDEKWLQKHIQQQTLQAIRREAKRTGLPIFVIVDDSLCEKTKPSSQAEFPIQGASKHFSHQKKQVVWGHQVVVMLLQCGSLCLPYAFCRYDKEDKSKIEIVYNWIQMLPLFHHPVYLLTDSWYTSKEFANVSAEKGLYLIGGLKTNRILFPQGIYTPARELASRVSEAETRLVTVGNASYHVYRYEGALKDIENAVVLLCWPQGKLGVPSALRCFLSMNASLSDEMILDFYDHRWSIEIFFQTMKETFSFDRYQIRSIQSIERFWTLLFLTYLYVSQTSDLGVFAGLRSIRKQRIQGLVEWVYLQSQWGVPLHQVQKLLNIA